MSLHVLQMRGFGGLRWFHGFHLFAVGFMGFTVGVILLVCCCGLIGSIGFMCLSASLAALILGACMDLIELSCLVSLRSVGFIDPICSNCAFGFPLAA